MQPSNSNGSQSSRAKDTPSRRSSAKPSENENDSLPDIKSARSKQLSRGSSRIVAQTPQNASKSGIKSFQLAEQFQAEKIMEKQRTDNFSSKILQIGILEDEKAKIKAPIKTKPSAVNLMMPQQTIDFHRINDKSPSQMSFRSNHSSKLKSSRRSYSARPQKKTVPKKVNAWETFEVNQFKVRNQQPSQIIDKLKMLIANDIPFMSDLPPMDELDSTDPLDSVMIAFVDIITAKNTDFTDELKQGIHLATGTRTEFCESILKFVCHHQKLEQAFRDSVEFFMESLTSVVKLEDENKTMKESISQLLSLKEDGILVKFNLEKRLKEQMARVDQIQEMEKQAQNRIRGYQKQLADKNSECESLEYRLKHFQEINGMMDPPGLTGAVSVGPGSGGGAVPNTADDKSESRINSGGASSSVMEQPKIRDLQTLNQKLQEELQEMRDSMAQKDNSEHFRKIQDLFNKIQIENKNLRIYNQKCESKLESKQNLINHLEGKVTSVMVEKEEIIIKLKSEIVLLKNKLELDEEKFQNKLEMQHKKLEYDFKNKYSDTIKELEGQVSDLDKQKKDLRKRLTRLHKEHEELSMEFTSFRREKEDQENFRNKQFKSLEDKITYQQQQDLEKINNLKKYNEDLENEKEVIKKENNILLLRQKYLKQQTETLAKQKVFLFQTLHKGKTEIELNLTKMEQTMRQEQNGAYLVSVEQCIKRAKGMADMGTAALQNISQILSFLKIEKLHQLLSDEDELEELERNVKKQMADDQEEQRAALEMIQSTSKKNITQQKNESGIEQMSHQGLMIQKFLNKHGLADQSISPTSSAPISPPRSPHVTKHPSSTSEEYYMNNCPVELASICVKLLVDVLVQVGKCQSIADVPPQVSMLLQQINRKSDQTVEQEILNRYLNETKRIIDDQINELKNAQGVQIQQISQQQQQKIQEQLINPSSINMPTNEYDINNQEDSVSATEANEILDTNLSQPVNLVSAQEQLEQIQAAQLKLELQRVNNRLEEQKLKARNLQLNLAGKIVVLEEQLEHLNNQNEEQISQLEKTHQEELQKVYQGIDQREEHLLKLVDEYRDEVKELQFKIESSWKPAEESQTVKKMEKGTKGNLYRLMKDEYETRFQKNSELLDNYRTSINEFVYLREDLRGSFTLAFDYEKLGDGLINMLNESMLKYYLSKTFVLDKSKFRFLRSEQLHDSMPGSDKKVKIIKLIIEVVAEDQAKVAHLFKNVKAQIKDGTSLLYDFMPLYFGMNLGSSGFSTHHNLKDFGLLSKTGQVIDGEDYVISVMRNKFQPLIFKIIAFNLELREEFMMELSESDIYELVEGDQQLLKNLEPDALIQKITTNLNLIVRDKLKVLTCEQKIFFNEIWMKSMESAKNQQTHNQSMMETSLNQSGIQNQQMQSYLTNTAARTTQLSRLRPKNEIAPKELLNKFNKNVGCQTDYEISTLYEGFENVYRGIQKLGEVTHMRLQIQESIKTSTLVFTFDDLTSLKKIKFSLYEKDSDDQYVIHSESMKISDNHHILIAIEYIQQQGLLIRMHDILECKTSDFSLFRKQNGHFTRLSEDSTLDMLMKEDFRSFIYELTYVVDTQENENQMRNCQYLFREDENSLGKKSSRQIKEENEQKKQMDALKRESAYKAQAQGKLLPRRKRAQLATRLILFSHKAFYKDKWNMLNPTAHHASPDSTIVSVVIRPTYGADAHDYAVSMDWRNVSREKGLLLYRNVFMVRCIFNNNEEVAQDSVVTLYLKDQMVNIEVSLYNEPSRMQIASSVHCVDLFGEDPTQVPFKERISHLDNMMSRFFIISDNSNYHMKVENDAAPIEVFLEEKKREAILKNPKENKGQEYDVILNAQRIREIQDEKEKFLNLGKATKYSRFTDIDGEVHEVEMLFIKKVKVKTEKSGGRYANKKMSTYGKTQQEIAQVQIEQFLDEQCNWDSIYFEIIDQNREVVTALYDKKKLSMMLSKDEFFDWRSAMGQVDPQLLDYIKRSIKIDKSKSEVSLHNKENVEQNILQKYRKVIGGKYIMRQDLEFPPDEQRIIKREMIANSEIEFSEFLYDIKIFKVYKIANRDIIAYQIEIFTLQDADVVYRYNYPMNFSPDTHDPHSLVVDIFNLIEHPLKKYPEPKKGKSKLGSRASSYVKSSLQHTASQVVSADQTKLNSNNNTATPGLGTIVSSAQVDNEEGSQSAVITSHNMQNVQTRSPFKQLFRKYIDNRVLLFIQETRFPRQLDLILVEPCSQLQWRHHIEPMQITTGLASMHIVEQATLEMFLSVLLDENENCEPEDHKLFEYNGSQSVDIMDDWKDLKEIDPNSLFVDKQYLKECDISITIKKFRESFNIVLSKPEAQEPLEIRINPEKGDTQLGKIIRQNHLYHSVLLFKKQGELTTIKIITLSPTSIKTVFKFTFFNQLKEPVDLSDDEITPGNKEMKIFTARDLQGSTIDALRRYYGAQTIEQSMRINQNQKMLIEIENDDEYEEPTIFENIDQKKQSIHATRQLQKYIESLDTKKIVLHRKTFYDDTNDKLILMHICLEYNQKEFDEQYFQQDVHSLSLTLKEPEIGLESNFIYSIEQFLTSDELQEELETGGLKDMKHIKQMAKQILEERIQPMLLTDEEYQEGMSNYTFQIIFGRKQEEFADESPEPEGYQNKRLSQGENQQSTIMEAASIEEDMDENLQ